jgi:hypothetical protein
MRVALQLAVLMMLSGASYGRTQGTFAEPESTLLFSDTSLRLTTSKQGFVVPNPPGLMGKGFSPLPLPALAPRGDLVAGALALPIDAEHRRFHLVIGVYSLLNNSWRTYGDFCSSDRGSVAFSPEGTKVAFISNSKEDSSNCDSSPKRLRILDLVTGNLTTVPYPAEALMENARLGWSPDGKYLAAQSGHWVSPPQHIVVIEVASGIGKTIAEGTDPSWSPKGDWIAYTDAGSMQKCMLIHPDGTAAKVVRDLSKEYRRGYWKFYYGAVWSPDGGKLLLNEYPLDVPGRLVVTMLDLTTGKVTTESKDGMVVFGWSPKAGD